MSKAYKKVPEFWWDFDRSTTYIIIECDDDRTPIVWRKVIPAGDATGIIDEAEKIIEDLKSGRVNIKTLLGKLNE